MAQTIKLKRSATQNAVPSTSSLALGELAINTYDGKLFIKKNVSGTESIVTIGEVGAGSIGPTELASTAVTAGSYGSTSAIPVITIDADGRITSASTATISGLSANSVTSTEIAANAVGISELNVSDGTDGQVLTTDGNGNLAFEDQSGGAASATAFSTNIASGDGSTTAFTLSESPSAESKIIAFINGVFQNQDAYTISGTTLTFDTAPISGTNNVVVYVIGDVYSGESVLISNFSGNGTTTAFTLANNPGNENNTQVYIDGVYQQKTTYSVSGTTLTFSSAPPTGTNNIEVVMLTSTTVNTPAAGSVVTASMADDSVTASKIVSSAVTTAKIADSNVTTAKIADSNVTTAKIADDAVTIGKIADAALVIESEGISSNDNDTTLPTSAAVKDYVDTQVAGKDALSELSGDTDDVTEGSTNLYFTNARADARITNALKDEDNMASNSATHIPSQQSVKAYVDSQVASKDALSELSGDTDDVTEGSTNLYYTDARVGTYISGNRTYGNITTTGYLAGPSTFTIDPAAVGDNTGTLVIAGNLQVDGTTTTVNSTTLTVDDKLITLGSGSANAGAANGAGIEVDISGATNPSLTYDGTNDEWDFNKDINVTGTITSSGNITGTLATAAQPNITSLGTLTGLTGGTGDLNWDSGTLFVDSSANAVGIGTTSLSSPLEVRCDSNNRGISIVEQGVGTETWKLGVNTDGDLIFLDSLDTTASVTFQDATGYVGIGLTDPSAILHVEVPDNTEFFKATITGNESWAFKGASGSGATDYVSFGLSGSTQCMTWQEDGNVGIGTTSPDADLHVYDSDGDCNLILETGTNNSQLAFGDSADNFVGKIQYNHPSNFMAFHTNGSEAMRIDSSGNVQIDGTEIVNNSDKGKINLWNSSSRTYALQMYHSGVFGSIGMTGAQILLLKTDDTQRIRITAPGTMYFYNEAGDSADFTWDATNSRVGIGTTSPSKSLSVKAPSGSNGGIDVFHNNGNKVAELVHHGSGDEGRLSLLDSGSTTVQLLGETGQNSYINSGRVGIGTSSPSGSLHLTTKDSDGADVHYVAQNTTSNRIAGYKILDESGNNYVSLTYDNGGNRGNLNLGQADGEILYVYGGSTIKSGFGIDLSGTSRELSMFHTTSGSNGNISLGQRLESTGAYTEHMRVDYKGTKLADGAMAYEQDRPFFSGANANSYSTSTNLAYTKSTDQYSVTGEAFKGRVRARAYTKYVHMKTNLSSDNIMFFFRIYGYFYNYGVNECVRGGYTYQSGVITESVANAYNANSNYTIGDFYRSSSGNYLCVRLDVHHTAYTEGEALIFFGSHSNTITRELQITDMQHRDDGNNAY